MRRAVAVLTTLSVFLPWVLGCLAAPDRPEPVDTTAPAEAAATAEPSSFGNVPFWTMGGKQWWADELWESGWRIQKSIVTGHRRLLDPSDVRRGWGNFEGCVETLDRYRDEGEVDPVADHVVVFLHGVWRSKDSMRGLSRGLEKSGYQVASLNYPSTRWSLEGSAAQIEALLNRLPANVNRVSFVTHSMGGLVARQLLGDPAASWRQRATVDRLVMIFPPNQGSVQADRWEDNLLYRGLFGPAGQQMTTDVAPELPIPDVPTGIIAGGRGDDEGRNRRIPGDDDETVGVSETVLEGADFLLLDVEHTHGMNDERTIAAVLRFLAEGRF